VVLALSMTGASGARGDRTRPVEHEPIAPNPADDVLFGLRIDGDLPGAIETPSGLVTAPDPREPVPLGTPAPRTTQLAGHDEGPSATAQFSPDLDTRRPDTLPYSDPFSPSTAPFKRLVAFDDVDAQYTLRVRDARQSPIPVHSSLKADGTEDQFYGDIVLDLAAGQPTRIPSVGAGARVIHARLGVGAEDVDFEMLRDSADNWFVRTKQSGRARLVLELSIARDAFGGAFHEEIDHHLPTPLPSNVQADAMVVATRIGLPRATRRETVEALVDYFRGFTESDEPLARDPGRSMYLDLALSQKGVCRHRAYAFVITALALGLRSRMVLNEAHAWVEVADGEQWKRVDLGGAGMLLNRPEEAKSVPYKPPPDPFDWPPGALRGEDLARTAPSPGSLSGSQGAGSGAGSRTSRASPAGGAATGSSGEESAVGLVIPTVTVALAESRALRGQLVHVHGAVLGDGTPCPHSRVVISLDTPRAADVVVLGELATDADGSYAGAFVVPSELVLGDYELIAATLGDGRCAASVSR
jgi:hypothetical protein